MKNRNTFLKKPQEILEVPSSKDTPLVIYYLPNVSDDITNVKRALNYKLTALTDNYENCMYDKYIYLFL